MVDGRDLSVEIPPFTAGLYGVQKATRRYFLLGGDAQRKLLSQGTLLDVPEPKMPLNSEWHVRNWWFDGPDCTSYATSTSSFVQPNAASSSQRCVYERQRSYAGADG
jgi:hypothetical protein